MSGISSGYTSHPDICGDFFHLCVSILLIFSLYEEVFGSFLYTLWENTWDQTAGTPSASEPGRGSIDVTPPSFYKSFYKPIMRYEFLHRRRS